MKRILPAFFALAMPLMAAAAKVDFNYDIRPIISAKCFHCHGPDEKSRKAKLRLDLRADAIAEHESGLTIVPGDVAASELVKRILSTDRDEVMPPPKEQHQLTAQEIELLKRWIAEGAEYKEHWAFIQPVRSAIPSGTEIESRIADWEKRDATLAAKLREQRPALDGWAKNPIDSFVLDRLLTAGMLPSPEADPYTLCRRLFLDLTGLPPSPAEVEEFVHDLTPGDDDKVKDTDVTSPPSHRFIPSSPAREKALEKWIDRLLASPAFGERWAKMWLDLARYADSTGYGSDFFRLNIWPWRDWVIHAFNNNLPYDEFTVEQLAGDLLPNATPQQIAATAFHRNTMTNREGGTVPEEYRVAAVKDRIATTGQVWMGLTVGCAQCHSHKFDPIPQRDYYRFFGVFNETEDANRPDEEPTLPLPSDADQAKTDSIKKDIAALQTKMKAHTPELDAEQRAWEEQMSKPADWHTLAPLEIKAASGATLAAQDDGSYLAIGTERPEKDVYTLKAKSDLHGITAFRVEVLPDDSLPAHGPGRADNGNAVLSELRVTAGPPEAQTPHGRFVRVTLPSAPNGLALAEVQVFSNGANLALKGDATQSGTDYEGEAKRAIDGKTDGDFKKNSVSHTQKGGEAWWEVDLLTEADIDAITIWNRTDGKLGSRLTNFRVSVLDSEHQPVWEQTIAAAPSPSVTLSPGDIKTVALRNASADFSQSGWTAAMATDGDPHTGWAWAPKIGQPHAAVFEAATPLNADDKVLTFTLRQEYGQRHTLGRFRISATAQKPAPRELSPEIKTILALDTGARSPAQQEELTAYFRPLSRTFAELGKQVEAKRAAMAAIKPVQLPVMRELPANKQRETHLLNKGNYLAPGEKLEPGLLSSFASFVPANTKVDRLTAARWIVNPENPLTARVAVNRFWSQLFGVGIVETEEDLGSQGALPSHPELLDWLAVTFKSPRHDAPEIGLGWDMKALLKLIVTSATYRQSSRVTPEMLEKDARNRLLAHAPRRRLEAEAVRDQALALSGLLSQKIGGPSVYPPQPDGLWNVAFNGGQNAYPTSKGEDRYRRGIYTFWRRTMPPPSMVTFDAPSRETCTVRRIATNTPLQAFVTMNDPVFVECAQSLARRIVREGGADTDARLRFALRLCLARPAAEEQVKTLGDLFANELATYQNDRDSATKLASDPLAPLPTDADPAELAAWTVVANVLLNLDGVLTKN